MAKYDKDNRPALLAEREKPHYWHLPQAMVSARSREEAAEALVQGPPVLKVGDKAKGRPDARRIIKGTVTAVDLNDPRATYAVDGTWVENSSIQALPDEPELTLNGKRVTRQEMLDALLKEQK